MKNMLIGLLLLAVHGLTYGQTKSIQNFYDKYANHDEVTNISLSGFVLKLATSYTSDEETERMINKITQVRVLIMEDGNLVQKADLKSLTNSMRKDNFEELMKIREKDNLVDFYIKEDQDKITNVLMLISSNDGFLLFSLEGLLNFSDLNNINIDVDGVENFKKIPKNKKDLPRA